jgi:peptidoglycan/LPS O-acetylase OafA/YrhL
VVNPPEIARIRMDLETHHPDVVAPRDVRLIGSAARIPALDGLRGIAILLVLLYHGLFQLHSSWSPLSRLLLAGRLTWSGVDLFFVLSGFLIGGILLDAKISHSYFRTFYLRRAYRILPLYILALALFSIRFVTSLRSTAFLWNFSPSSIPWMSYVTFTQNIWMALVGNLGVGAMAVTWSLAVEEQFYLTAPFVVRRITGSRLVLLLVSVVVAAPLLRTGLHLFFKNGNFAAYVLMPCRADALCLGVLAALLVRTPPAWKFLLARRRALCWVTGFLFVGLAGFTLRGYPFSTLMVTVGYSWLAFFYTGCLLLAVTATRGVVVRILCNRLLMQLGVLAYCTYLVHVPAIEVCRRVLGLQFSYATAMAQFVGGFLGIAFTLAVSKFSWHFFEKPLLRRGHAYKY